MQKAHALRDRLARLTRSRFVRNVATVATGAAAAQGIRLAFSPLLTRLYGPEAFGLQGMFFSVTGTLAPFAALSYELALVLPKRHREAVALLRLALLTGLCTSGLVLAVLLVAGDTATRWMNAEALSSFVYLVPLMMLVGVGDRVVTQWLSRHKAYRINASFGVASSLLTSSAKAAMGVAFPSAAVLIVTNILGGITASVLRMGGWRILGRHENRDRDDEDRSPTLKSVAHEYREWPLLQTPRNLINGASLHLPILLLGAYFGAESAGRYSIAMTALAVPTRFIGDSIMPVFYPRITEAIRVGEDARTLILKATLGMAATGALPYLAVFVGGAPLFSWVFGSEWGMSGTYAQWLAPALFLEYVSKPAIIAAFALRRQGSLLIYTLSGTASRVGALWIGFALFGDEIVAVGLFSLSRVLGYVWLIPWVVRLSAKAKAA